MLQLLTWAIEWGRNWVLYAKEETMDKEVVKVKARCVKNKRDGVWDLFIKCPYCGEKHHHGGGIGETPNLGFRAAHCAGSGTVELREYELI